MIEHVHFIGCGGAGTQPLAVIFHELGFRCSGSDLLSNRLTEKLKSLGIPVAEGHAAENIPAGLTAENALVVYTSAADDSNPEIVEAKRRGIPLMRRGEALAHIGTRFKHTVAVAGSHGKTSTTAMIAHTLGKLGMDPGFLIGGSVPGLECSGSAGAGRVFVTEVDESDSTNALFHAETAVVTNIEDDHSWSVGGVDSLFESFVRFAENAKRLVYVSGPNTDRLFRPLDHALVLKDEPAALPFPAQWGGYQKLDASTAFAVVKMLYPRIPEAEIVQALVSFPGVDRRLSLRIDSPAFRLIEDYAHHPTELRATLSALRETNPGRRLVVIFQPHRYARLKRYLKDFAALLSSKADQVFVTPVFAAWTDESDVNSETLAGMVPGAKAVSGSWHEIFEAIAPSVKKGDLVAVIGAGDVNALVPEFRKLAEEREHS